MEVEVGTMGVKAHCLPQRYQCFVITPGTPIR
jgi:hypothetical protein